MNPEVVINTLRKAPAYGRRSYSTDTTLGKQGELVWNQRVVPALRIALPRAIQAGLAHPYFYCLSAEDRAGINKAAYNEGVRETTWAINKIADPPPLAQATRMLTKAFAVPRFARYTTEPHHRGQVTQGIANENLKRYLEEREIDPKHLDSFRSGVATAAAWLALKSTSAR